MKNSSAATMFDSKTREGFHRRIERLRPDYSRRWGRMNVDQMVCHLADQLRLTLGEIPAARRPSPLRFLPIKLLVIHVLPWPKGRIQGPPEAFITSPGEWNRDITALRDLLELFASRADQKTWPPHPMFGRMSGSLWARLTCRHFDHHLRQFGA